MDEKTKPIQRERIGLLALASPAACTARASTPAARVGGLHGTVPLAVVARKALAVVLKALSQCMSGRVGCGTQWELPVPRLCTWKAIDVRCGAGAQLSAAFLLGASVARGPKKP